MNLLEDIAKDRKYLVELATKSTDKETISALDDRIGKLDVLSDLLEAWINEKLGDLKLLTDKRLELELKQCDEQIALHLPHGERDPAVQYWTKKRRNLLLLQQLVQAWHGDSLALTNFAVSIQE